MSSLEMQRQCFDAALALPYCFLNCFVWFRVGNLRQPQLLQMADAVIAHSGVGGDNYTLLICGL